VDFLSGLVAPGVGVFVTELGQQTHCVLLLSCHLFSCFYFWLLYDVGTLNGTSFVCAFSVETLHRTS